MLEEYQICPYTGLRSFTEDESLYFKGREEHIDQATEQLQRNKFLMLTGASGDGKSSLVYAGIIPNARAGFLKSMYTQWCVADFRPERTPFHNLCRSVARQLDISSIATVEAELHHGFSALVDLYKNSKRYADPDSISWQQSDANGKAVLKREAANLIILVDQFEEFFTNPENYQRGVPSADSNLTINLLLETARMALEEGLPIYVIFTMRSDFIGQCAAFRGLPEYIGFSQFFVPRLNRSQLQLVIEEPAVLSGNKITRRLTERLIHDISDGVDQLPILQHALNQIWHAANSGKDEMDLLHYAMVGGMRADELPEEQAVLFKNWFDSQPVSVKAFYREPDLKNVLDTHTSKLYEQAASLYTIKTGHPIADVDAKAIVKNAFVCLTKIDQSRAVRNRMTLQEITNILGKPEFGTKEVAAVLDVFRESGNTFLRPFATEAPELGQDDVLDITHESLIRNWEYLGQWATEEYNNYTVSLDFGQQLSRWVKSGKDSAHLFSIGPLTYFETWFNKLNPNAWWIARYIDQTDPVKRLETATRTLNNSKEFISQSASRHMITRTLMRYGAGKISIVLGVLVFLVCSAFGIKGYLSRQNSAVQDEIRDYTLTSAKRPKIQLAEKATLINEELKTGVMSIADVANSIENPIEKAKVLTGIATQIAVLGRGSPERESLVAFTLADSILAHQPFTEKPKLLSSTLQVMNDLRAAAELQYFYQPSARVDSVRKHNALTSGKWALEIATKQPAGFTDMQEFGLALENAINYRTLTSTELRTITTRLSPFEGAVSPWMTENFKRDKLLVRGHHIYGYSFNGLYQFLGSVYAAQGNSAKALQCIDSLNRHSQYSLNSQYENNIDNAGNILTVFYLHHHLEALRDFAIGYSQRKQIPVSLFYQQIIGRTLKELNIVTLLNFYWWMGNKGNVNVPFASTELLSFLYDKERAALTDEIRNPNDLNFQLAVSFKNQGGQLSVYKKSPDRNVHDVEECFDRALTYYNKVSTDYLEAPGDVIWHSTNDLIKNPRKYLMIYPDVRVQNHPAQPRTFFYSYCSDAFVSYILSHDLFKKFYSSPDDLDVFVEWFNDYHNRMWAPVAYTATAMSKEVLEKLEARFANKKHDKIDVNFLYLYLGKYHQDSGEEEKMLYDYRNIDRENIFNSMRSGLFDGAVDNHAFSLIGHAVKGFATTNHFDEAYRLVTIFKNPSNRSSLYSYSASELLRAGRDGPLVQRLLDSATVESNRADTKGGDQPHLQSLAFALTLQGGKKNSVKAYSLIKNLRAKMESLEDICRAYGFRGELYEAMQHIPENISDTNYSGFLGTILAGSSERTKSVQWNQFSNGLPTNDTHYIGYVDEGN